MYHHHCRTLRAANHRRHVDAHLKSYDISDDLSVEFTPAVNYVYSPTVGGHRPTFGFNFNLNF